MFRGNSLVEWTREREFGLLKSAGNNHKKEERPLVHFWAM